MSPATTTRNWWDHAVGYEIYIRSFADGNGDGIGDFIGLVDKLDYLAWLGIDVVWITPFYSSPMRDWGYDVANYIAVDTTYGTLDDFDAVVERAHALGMKVIIDIVPNHCSDQHEWFQHALANPTGPYRDYFIWRDAAADGSLPNNWVGYFGGPTWTLDEASGQHYLHMFLPEQPDLNWRNPAVRDEFEAILRFWLDRGVDGFRIDVAQGLIKDEQLRSNPQLAPVDASMHRWEQWDCFEHQHDILQPETLAIFQSWNDIAAEYDALLLGETYDLTSLDRLDRLVSGGDALHVGFWFGAMHLDWTAESIRSTFAQPIDGISAGLGWAQNSHDEHRSVTRFGGGDVGRRRALSLAVLLAGLPGMPFLYQGEELGLANGIIEAEDKLDPVGGDDLDAGRDGNRTPIPWETGDGMGFSEPGVTPWLPFGGRTEADTAAAQRNDPDSMVHRYRQLLRVRRTISHIADAEFEWIELSGESSSDVVAFRRGDIVFMANVSSDATPSPLTGEVLFATNDEGRESRTMLAPDEARIVLVLDP